MVAQAFLNISQIDLISVLEKKLKGYDPYHRGNETMVSEVVREVIPRASIRETGLVNY